MAWTRTSLSMTSFGFTIYKVLEALASQATTPVRQGLPRDAGLFLTALGTLAMVMGSIEYWTRIKELRRTKYLRLMQPSFIMALIMCAVGILIFVGIISRTL